MFRRKRPPSKPPFDPEIAFELWADPTVSDRAFCRFLDKYRDEIASLLHEEPYSPDWLSRTDLPRWVSAPIVQAHLREHGGRVQTAVLALSEHWLRRHHSQVVRHIRSVEADSLGGRDSEAGKARRLVEAITGRLS